MVFSIFGYYSLTQHSVLIPIVMKEEDKLDVIFKVQKEEKVCFTVPELHAII